MKVRKFYSIAFSLLVFAVLNIPSIKIIYSSSIINLGTFFGIWLVGFVRVVRVDRSILKISLSRKHFLLLFSLMWMVMFIVSLFNSPSALNLSQYIQYFVTMFIVIGLTLFLKNEDISRVFRLQIMWGTLLSIVNLTIGIKLNTSLGQHYLTVGVPIAASLISISTILFYQKGSRKRKLSLLGLLSLNVLGVSSLIGRTPVVLALGIPAAILVLSVLLERSLKNKIKLLISIAGITPVIYYLFNNYVSDHLIIRFQNLSFEDNSRSGIFEFTGNLITNNPAGLGLTSTFDYGFYPHNIFLEIGVSGGVIALIIFSAILFMGVKKGFHAFKLKSYPLVAASVAIYYFLTWNVSFDLSSSYMPFGALAIMIISTEKNQTEKL